jgi:hypothetical protein
VRNNAFYHVPSLGRLNLSGNKIYKIEDLAFKVEFIKNIDFFSSTLYSTLLLLPPLRFHVSEDAGIERRTVASIK